MKTSDFYYDLPQELIAQHPSQKRDESRLLHLRGDGSYEDLHFKDILDLIRPEDVLVINNTKVLPARIFGHRPDKDEKIEVLLVKELEPDFWQCMVRPGRKMKLGTTIEFSSDLSGTVEEITDDGLRLIRFNYEGVFIEILEKLGEMPLPPYIHEKLEDQDRYQTVYAKYEGSAAAPTAGLHFTEELLQKIKDKGTDVAEITLHVGLGTFRPVQTDTIEEHHMHSEYYRIDEVAAEKINRAKARGGRVIAVGTTSIRTLESAMNALGEIRPDARETNIFIYPGYEFQIVDAIVTNFHLPESTLIMLVSAFSGRETILKAYEHAVEEKYRFFSFGDAMFIESRNA
ncbi:MAG: tRNA preQ1(34) S-adenosylmethionine ribosyltransferase-isomerase QueA [Peptoniphilus sp.]|nr:tRNA preQ1(34) S-adenosylmethionine ribosyltransferase-isomerase QueA [Peptoniphilus sp.]MDD7363353.1 tRNA preQ1(34) S-adenosylmethionine ribosyltransferase-isomerase QueA [Bacillota bacterium]MDY6044272.1 tRNA preQ1(34) S-adenosylmethionine ribosyltransferase-isomerase QueA [Peptoniphilus sp.]